MKAFELTSVGFGGSKAAKVATPNPEIKDKMWFFYYNDEISYVPVVFDKLSNSYSVVLKYDSSVPMKNIMTDIVLIGGRISEINTVNCGNSAEILVYYNITDDEKNILKYK